MRGKCTMFEKRTIQDMGLWVDARQWELNFLHGWNASKNQRLTNPQVHGDNFQNCGEIAMS